MIHGDFHFDNFLIDTKNSDNFILIDPRREKRGYDYTYDLGKLWHSFHGLYDFIHEGKFKLDYTIDEKKFFVSSFGPEIHQAMDTYKYIYQHRQILIDMVTQLLGEKNAEEQILFSEAVHFCSLAPLHLLNDGIEKGPICRYLTGVKLINELFERLR